MSRVDGIRNDGDGAPRTRGWGAQLWAQVVQWRSLASFRCEHIWVGDRLLSAVGDWLDRPVFEGYAALAVHTTHAGLGLLVGDSTFRLLALVTRSSDDTRPHQRWAAIVGLGSGANRPEHRAARIDFGTNAGARLDMTEERLSIVTLALAGESVSYRGKCYRTDNLLVAPGPVQAHLSIMVGGTGEHKRLHSVAQHADIWNSQISLAPRKLAALHRHCADIGRDVAEIRLVLDFALVLRDSERRARRAQTQILADGIPKPPPDDHFYWFYWSGTPGAIAERLNGFRDLGFASFMVEYMAPYDKETMTCVIRDVRLLRGRRGGRRGTDPDHAADRSRQNTHSRPRAGDLQLYAPARLRVQPDRALPDPSHRDRSNQWFCVEGGLAARPSRAPWSSQSLIEPRMSLLGGSIWRYVFSLNHRWAPPTTSSCVSQRRASNSAFTGSSARTTICRRANDRACPDPRMPG